MALLHWEDAVLISERLALQDLILLPWSHSLHLSVQMVDLAWGNSIAALSLSLTTAAADSTPLLSSSLDMVQQEEN